MPRVAASPAAFQCSLLSAYFHFGQISPVQIALRWRYAEDYADTNRPRRYLEELIVRRESR